jgi:hypothetical protein
MSGQEKPQYWIPENQWQAGYSNQHQNFSYQPESAYMAFSTGNANNNNYAINNHEFHHQSNSQFQSYYA